jgi:hypothetical protein
MNFHSISACDSPVMFLVVKANAGSLPLKDNSVNMILATPPYIGARRLRKGDYCTCNPKEYKLLLDRFLSEAIRVLKRRGHLLITPSCPPSLRRVGARFVRFNVFRKGRRGRLWTCKFVRAETFWTHFVDFEGTCWWALPVGVYRDLVRKYSNVGEVVVHVFSGSGTSGIAAIEGGRKPLLIDLHYHGKVRARLRRHLLHHN